MKSCFLNGQQLPQITINQSVQLGVSLEIASRMSKRQLTKRIKVSRDHLWECQKKAADHRAEWFKQTAQNIARAEGEADWEKKMKAMERRTIEMELNRKLNIAIKGLRTGLNMIKIPKHEWYYSKKTKDLLRYDDGVFEAYTAFSPSPDLIPENPILFYTHHHLKAIPLDAVPAEVARKKDYYRLLSKGDPCNIWREVTNPKEIEHHIMLHNKRHLRQATIESGKIQEPIMQKLMEDDGTNDLVRQLYSGELDLETVTDETIRAYLQAMIETATKKHNIPMVQGCISKEEFQGGFKNVDERTTSSPSGLHYTLWKAVASQDDLAGWMSIMMSLPFMYGFVNERWTTMVDAMIEKKKGNRKIHMLRLIGLLEADFNTALKIIFSRKLMSNAEKIGLHDEQWGCRRNRTCHDPALRKMMTFEYGRYLNATIALFINDQTACFDRMYPSNTNIVAGSFGVNA